MTLAADIVVNLLSGSGAVALGYICTDEAIYYGKRIIKGPRPGS